MFGILFIGLQTRIGQQNPFFKYPQRLQYKTDTDWMDQSIALNRQQRQWNKVLSHHIDRYSNLRDWSELAAWLNKLKNLLAEYKGTISDKQILLKKLATSLSPALPIALHQLTLEIYEILFSAFITIDQLQLTCLGLFTFYNNANLKNKHRILDIFFKYFTKFGNELKVMSSGLIITVLPSLIQMHEPLVKEVNSFFELISKKEIMGQEIFIQSIWIAITRSTNCRVAGLKYLSSKIGKGDQEDDNQEEEDTFWLQNTTAKQEQNSLDSPETSTFSVDLKMKESKQELTIKNSKQAILRYCPHVETVVINALLCCLEDSNVLTLKNALDFLYKYLPLKTQIIGQKAKSKLTKAIVCLLARRDMSITRKINLWLFGKPDIENKYTILQKNVGFLTSTLIDYLKQKEDSNVEPLKIIFNLFSEHQNLPSLILTDLAKQMVSYCSRSDFNIEILKLMNRIIDKVEGKVSLFADSLGKELLDCVDAEEYREAEKILQLIMAFMNKIVKPEESRDVIFDMLRVLVQSYTKTNWKQRDYMKTSISQSLQLIQKIKQSQWPSRTQKASQPTFKKKAKMDQAMNIDHSLPFTQETLFTEHINLYANLLKIIQKDKENQLLNIYQRELVFINKMQVKLFEVFGIYNDQWVYILIKVIYLNNPNYFLEPIEVIGEALERDTELRKKILKQAEDQTKESFIEISIRKIWNILSLGHLQSRIIPLLLRLTKFFPHYFENILNQQFKVNNEISINKFSLFWNLSPKYSNIISHQQLQEICKPGLFRMLGYLDNGNPLVKYNSNIWINDCFPNFQRVLNPLMEILLKPKEFWYKTLQGQYVFVFEPQKQKIIHVLTHIKSIVKHTSVKFYKFSLKTLTPNLLPYYQVFKQDSDQNESKIQSEKSKQVSTFRIEDKGHFFVFEGEDIYINCLFEIIVKLAGSKYLQKQNPGIDLVACQTLQVLIRNIPNSQVCLHIIERNLTNILKCLHFATVNREHLLQIQLLNLLKIIFFQSNLRKSNNDHATKFLREIISSSLFLKTILQGLDSEFPYIKQRFVEFINLAIVLILQYHSNSSEIISRILNTYCTKISVSNQKKMEISNKKDLMIGKINSEILILFAGIKQLLSYFLNLNIKQFQKQKNQNDADSGVFSLYSYKSFVELKVEKKTLESNRAKKACEEISRQIAGQLSQLFITMTSCWTVSQLMQYYKISMEGLALFEFDEFHTYNKQLYLTLGRFEVQESVQNFIVNLVRVLLNKYPSQLMNAMIQAWTAANTVQLKIKIIEILNFCSIPIENFYTIMCDCVNSQRIAKKKKSTTLSFDGNYNIEHLVIHFCQAFTHYNFQNFAVFQTANLINAWLSFLKFIKLFEEARNVQTLFALLELIDLFMKKNNPREIVRDQRIKKDLMVILNIFNDAFALCSGRFKVHCDQKKIYEFSAFIPLPSSIFDCYLIQTSKKQDAKLPYLCFNQVDPKKCEEYCRIYAFLMFKRLGYNLLVCLYRDDVSLSKKIRQFVLGILPIIEDKTQDSLLIENASQVLLSILQKKHGFLKDFKNDILQVFNKDDFFICSSRTLHCWVKIIDMIIDNNKDHDHDIFTQYLDKVSLVSSIFSSYSLQTKKKIKSFQRICFILYAGKKDKYNEKAQLLIDKIIDVIKNTDAPQPVLILIFFCLRILILRMSPQKLSKLFANLWQMIMFLLMNIFKEPVKEQSRLNLVWAALKLIEMISIMRMSEFHQHQWMFFFDFIGIQFSQVVQGRQSIKSTDTPVKKTNGLTIPASRMSEKQIPLHSMKFLQEEDKQDFQLGRKPMICRFLPSNYVTVKSSVHQIEEERHLIIKEDKIDDVELLNTKALLLSSYLVNSNEQRMKFQMGEIEELIENDFLNLDEFIFKFK